MNDPKPFAHLSRKIIGRHILKQRYDTDYNNFCFLFRHVPLSLPEFRQFAVLTLLPPQDYLAESSNFHPDGAPNQKEKLHPPVVH